MGAVIKGIEYEFPGKRVSNEDLQKEFPDYDFSKFESKVGILARYVTDENTSALDLAELAGKKLLNRLKLEVDFILYCTQSPEYYLPSTACILQDRLGLPRNVGAFDFNLGCSGYTYGLAFAKGLINGGIAKNVLLVTAETYTKYINPNDKSNRAIFGDAATATLISYEEQESFGEFSYGTDGSGYDKLIVKNGCSIPYDEKAQIKSYGSDNQYSDNNLYMDGPAVFNFTSDVVPEFTEELLEKNGLEAAGIGQFIFHQANAFMLNTMRKLLGAKKEQFYINLKEGGNTVSCTIPIALKRYSDSLEEADNQKIALVGFGVGLSWSGGVINLKYKL